MSYNRELVERLLFTVWDRDAVYGVPVPQAPPADMPRAASNKKESNTLYAHLADMNTGWEKTDLRREERQSLFLRFALDMTEQEIGRILSRPQQTVSYQIFAGIGKIVAQLNGGVFSEAMV